MRTPSNKAVPDRVLVAGLVSLVLMSVAWWTLGRHPSTSRDGLPQFAIPAGWQVERDDGRRETYQQVRLLGPRNQEDTYTAFMAIRVRPLRAEAGWYEHIAELVRQEADGALEGSLVDGPHPVRLAGLPAQELTVSVTLRPPAHHEFPPGEVPLITRAVFFEHDHAGYEIMYSADAREYARYEPAFTALLDSFVIR